MISLNILTDIWEQIQPVVATFSLVGILVFLTQKITEGKINYEYSKKLENLKREVYRKDQAVKIAGVFAKIYSAPEYSEVNQLLWELSLWLPAERYKKLHDALDQNNTASDPRKILIEVRKSLGAEGELTENDILRYV